MQRRGRRGTSARKNTEIPHELSKLRGYIEFIIFPRHQVSKNGFAILKVNLSGESRIKFDPEKSDLGEWDDPKYNLQNSPFLNGDPNRIITKGTMPNPKVGDEILFTGYWTEDPERGRQFQFTAFEIILPTSQQGVIAYFSSDKFYGLGRTAAEKIVDALGENCLNLLKDNPSLAYEIPGLSQKQQTELAEKMAEHSALGDLIAIICRHGIGTGTAGRIYAQYGPQALNIVKENPYQLTKDIDGIGFLKADTIGEAVGIAKNSEFRIAAAIRHVLDEARGEGHCALRSAAVSDVVVNKLLGVNSGVSYGDVGRVGRSMIKAGELYREHNKEKNIDYIYLIGMYEAEVKLANKLCSMVGEVEGIDNGHRDVVADMVNMMEADMGEGFELAPEQRHAVIMALLNKLSVITGGPGTGKSTITRFIKAGYESLYPGRKIYLVSPTGRAAKRLSDATGGSKAATIHRTLGYNPEVGFTYNEYCPLPGPGLLIIDEASMMDVELACALFKAIPEDMQVVIIGDVNQLPSVGPGAVLGDIISSGAVPVTRLKYIYRQVDGSTISWLADKINSHQKGDKIPKLAEINNGINGNGDFEFHVAEDQGSIRDAVGKIIAREYAGGRPVSDIVVLTPMRERGAASARALNDVVRDIVNPATENRKEKKHGDRVFRHGDRIMWTRKNNYKKGLFNGDLGTALIGDRGEFTFLADNGNGGVPIELGSEDLAYVELAYAFTIHKAQGSEAPFVVVVCSTSHTIMLTRSLIYTGLTRAKEKLAIVGTQKAFNVAVRNNKVEMRGGLLRERLRGEI